MFYGGGNSFEIAHRAFTGIEIENLAQRNIQRTNATTDRSSQRALDGHAKIANGVDRIVRQPFFIGVKRLFAGEDFIPRDFALTAVGVIDRGVKNAPRSFPDITASSIALNERDDRIVRDLQFAADVINRRTVAWNGLPVVNTLHLATPSETFCSYQIVCCAEGALRRAWPNLKRYHKAARG